MFVISLLVASVAGVVPVMAGTAAAQAPDSIVVEGRANGHGRGMGQFGALGYAVDYGWNHRQILDHFYGGTRAGTVPNGDILVFLTRWNNHDLRVTSNQPFVVDGAWRIEPGQAVIIQVAGDMIFDIFTGPSCDGPWTQVADNRLGDTGPGRHGDHAYIEAVPVQANYGNDMNGVLINCSTRDEQGYRGALRLVEQGGAPVHVNRLPLEQYLRGVVGHESPPRWGSLPSGRGVDKGMQALMAQAVAARSYAMNLALTRRATGIWASDTCDTQACQVYQGAWKGTRASNGGRSGTAQDHGGTFNNSNYAIAHTAGEVRLDGAGRVSRTEFASSTGGYTSRPSEGNGFPAVPDLGDATTTTCRLYPGTFDCNPYQNWTKEIPRAEIEAAYPAVGTLKTIRVTKRNGLGAWGGRVQQIRIEGTGGTAVIDVPNWTQDSFRTRFGLRSDWYRFPQFEAPVGSGHQGFWTVKANGAVGAWGTAGFHGDASTIPLWKPIVYAASTPSGNGYWLTATDGGVFTYGDATFHGSAGGIALWKPIVAMAATPSGRGYVLAASDGGIFTYGDASFHGSMGGIPLVSPVVGMAATPSGRGYWMVAADGGIFTFGDATFYGSLGGQALPAPIVGMAASPAGNGYWLVAANGQVFTFGSVPHLGDRAGTQIRGRVIGLAASADSRGYWILTDTGTSYPFGGVADHVSSAAGGGVVAVTAQR
jgi:SpoIID/LytB domain protein